MFLAAMREKRDELRKNGFDVEYLDISHEHFKKPYEEKLKKAAQKKKYNDLVQIAKKTPQLVKVVGKGVDAKTPKQNNFPGSSPRK